MVGEARLIRRRSPVRLGEALLAEQAALTVQVSCQGERTNEPEFARKRRVDDAH
jgi:hypothetical protein